MDPRTTTRRAILASALLAVLTVFVFSTLRNYGPDTAVRRYHQALLEQDLNEVQRYTVGSVQSSSSRALINEVLPILIQGGSFQIGRRTAQKDPRIVFTEVMYTRRDRQKIGMVFVAERTELGWKVNADKTLYVLVKALGG